MKNKFFLFKLQFLIVACIPVNSSSAQQVGRDVRIGQDVTVNELELTFPYMVYVRKSRTEFSIISCTGTRISEKFSVTAAHCLNNGNMTEPMIAIAYKYGKINGNQLIQQIFNLLSFQDDVSFSELDILKILEEKQKSGEVLAYSQKFFLSEDYKNTYGVHTDIALILFDSGKLTSRIVPISAAPAISEKVTMVGYGAIDCKMGVKHDPSSNTDVSVNTYDQIAYEQLNGLYKNIWNRFENWLYTILSSDEVKDIVVLDGNDKEGCSGDSGSGWFIQEQQGYKIVALYSSHIVNLKVSNHGALLGPRLGSRVGCELFEKAGLLKLNVQCKK